MNSKTSQNSTSFRHFNTFSHLSKGFFFFNSFSLWKQVDNWVQVIWKHSLLPLPSCIWDWKGQSGSACPGGAAQRWQVVEEGNGQWRADRGQEPGSIPGSAPEHGTGQRRQWYDPEAEAALSWKPPTPTDEEIRDQLISCNFSNQEITFYGKVLNLEWN